MASVTGSTTARLYLRLLALVSLVAWLSIGVQILLLVGRGGLLPISPLLDEARRQGVPFHQVPSLFWLWSSDTALIAAVAAGASASLFGALRPGRAWLAISLPLYLSISIAAQDFCAFQWDFLLVEASFVSLFLDWRRPSRAALLAAAAPPRQAVRRIGALQARLADRLRAAHRAAALPGSRARRAALRDADRLASARGAPRLRALSLRAERRRGHVEARAALHAACPRVRRRQK